MPGPGSHHIPQFFEELSSEQRTEKGWQRDPGTRNEAFDLHVYNRAAVIVTAGEAIDWNKPPEWAKAFDARRDEPTSSPSVAPMVRRRRILDGGI